MIKSFSPDLVIAGPAFNAGRYGTACGTVAKMVQDELKKSQLLLVCILKIQVQICLRKMFISFLLKILLQV
ncbi:glycine/betaine/sarcosine/D-proline family reductase selenoprotein B [Brachyspira hyodysenteriae]|nr:glycine/sarcosine/betaine reductase selenoprotein B family protein [Brachyspira hyodysenteriae]MDA1468369.1 glycine/betaine/sarcosine/D-proline family reductase selenoprotein B [Brachyspira hyodysenteriae]